MTPRQLRVLEAFKDHVATHKTAPTMRVLADALGCSPSSAFRHMIALSEQGYLKCLRSRGRHPAYALTPRASIVGSSRAAALTDAELIDEVSARWGKTAAMEALVAELGR